jgi:tetratricopeptide (TPR) repeat protein
MTMDRFLRWLATYATLFVTAHAVAAQDDPRLDTLFKRLAAATDAHEAEIVENAIWTIWHQSGDADVDALLAYGIRAMAGGLNELALQAFTEVTRRAPRFAEGWNKRATVNYMMERNEDSIADIEKTLALEPRHFGALSGLGLVNLALGRDEAALEAFRRALAVDPHLPGAAERIRELEDRVKGQRM